MSKKNKTRNAAHVLAGKVEETVGHAIGNDKLVARGKSEQMRANLKQAGEKVKDAFRE